MLRVMSGGAGLEERVDMAVEGSVLIAPAGADAQWAEKIARALNARQLGLQLQSDADAPPQQLTPVAYRPR